MASYSVTADGVRMRAQPSTSAPIVIHNLGAGTTVTTVSDQTATAEGYTWRNVQTSAGQAGWVAAEFAALHDSPDRTFTAGGHLMSLLYPGSDPAIRDRVIHAPVAALHRGT